MVTLPEVAEARPQWLTRSEAALLLDGALGWYQERWCDVPTQTEHHRWRRSPFRITSRSAARFILIGLYTGTRPGAITDLQWLPVRSGGWVDSSAGVVHRRAIRATEAKNRKPPARIGSRMLAHLRRWHRLDNEKRERLSRASGLAQGKQIDAYRYIVTYDAQPFAKIRRSWSSAVTSAGLEEGVVTPHNLRHTRATWLMQAGIDIWEAAGSLGMSAKILEQVYGHHHPDFQKLAAEV